MCFTGYKKRIELQHIAQLLTHTLKISVKVSSKQVMKQNEFLAGGAVVAVVVLGIAARILISVGVDKCFESCCVTRLAVDETSSKPEPTEGDPQQPMLGAPNPQS